MKLYAVRILVRRGLDALHVDGAVQGPSERLRSDDRRWPALFGVAHATVTPLAG